MNDNRLYRNYKKRISLFYNIIIITTIFLVSNFFLIQVVFSNSYTQKIINSTKAYKKVIGKRGAIYDRNNNLLGHTVKKCQFWTNNQTPTKNSDKTKIINLLKKHLPQLTIDYDKIFKNKSHHLILVDDLLNTRCIDLIKESKLIKNFHCDFYNHRLYPYNELGAQLIGFTNRENSGRYGIEGFFDNILKPSNKIVEYNKNSRGRIVSANSLLQPKNGSDISLTIDIEIQEILQYQLKKAFIKNNAKSANGIIMDPFSGEIIAMASIPDFNLNSYKDLPMDSSHFYYTNRVISEPYEPGSTFKIINFANAIDKGINKNKKYYCEGGSYKNNYIQPFKDHEPFDSLSFNDTFIYSSNIGTIKVFEESSKKSFYDKMKKFGFGIKTNISLKGENSGNIRDLKYYNNNLRDLASASIGQSISVTNLQLALAYSSIANGGYLMKPKIIKKIKTKSDSIIYNKPNIIRRTIQKNTSEYFTTILNEVVNKGTGKKAYLDEINVGGKTGTAEIWNKTDKKYSTKNYNSSFASIFPIKEPKYVMIVTIDSPKYDKRWGGESAAPCTKEIINNILLHDKSISKKVKKNEKA